MTSATWFRVSAVLILLVSAWIQWTTARETHVIVPGERPDSTAYVSYAYNLREFSVYSKQLTWKLEAAAPPRADAISPPGYPLFLTLFLKAKPDMTFMRQVVLAQAMLGVITTLVLLLLALRTMRPAMVCVAGLLTALTPHLATISTYLLTESLFTLLLVGSVWAFVRAAQSNRITAWALAGFVFGLCCLVRPTLQALLPAAFLVIALARKWRHLLRPAAIATICWLALLLPWFLYQQSIPPAPATPNLLRAALYHGSFPDFVFENHTENYGFPYRDDPHQAEIMASNDGLFHWIGHRMRAEPLRYVRWYLLGKPQYFLSWNNNVAGMEGPFIYPVDASPYLSRPLFLLMHAIMFGLHWPLMLAGIAGGLIACLRPMWLQLPLHQQMGVRVVAITFLSAIAFHMIGAPYPRYGIPFWPLAYVLALVTMTALAHRIRIARNLSRAAPKAPCPK